MSELFLFLFVEKLGNSAPYVRFDFTEKDDLFVWLRAELEPTMNKSDLLFACFNNHDSTSVNEISR
jgi:hypothetical protein